MARCCPLVPLMNKPTKPIAPLAYTAEEAARAIGRSHTRIKRAIREREITARRDGRITLIEHAELQRWLASMPIIGRKGD
jgi:excisionase family DNA binding protein